MDRLLNFGIARFSVCTTLSRMIGEVFTTLLDKFNKKTPRLFRGDSGSLTFT
jgi:hypothetical protein